MQLFPSPTLAFLISCLSCSAHVMVHTLVTQHSFKNYKSTKKLWADSSCILRKYVPFWPIQSNLLWVIPSGLNLVSLPHFFPHWIKFSWVDCCLNQTTKNLNKNINKQIGYLLFVWICAVHTHFQIYDAVMWHLAFLLVMTV